jgi:predicted O-methyltransferase YrrM
MIDDELTRSFYKGFTIQQRQEAQTVFKDLFSLFKPQKIIEIGTGFGGLTLFVRDQTKDFCDFYSFDVFERNGYNQVRESGVNLHIENIFREVTCWDKFVLKDEWNFLLNGSPKLILCDGGHKKGEFNCFAELLKPGDIIMLHDYSTDKESFDSLNVWNWLECQYSDIRESCEKHKLEPFMHKEFLNVAWGCFIKK